MGLLGAKEGGRSRWCPKDGEKTGGCAEAEYGASGAGGRS